MKKIAITTTLLLVTGAANAVSVSVNGTFDMYDPTSASVDSGNMYGFIDHDAGTWAAFDILESWWELTWSAHDGVILGEGMHTIDTIQGGIYDITVGAGQIGGHILFSWGATTDIDVINVWDVATVGDVTTYTSTDIDGDGIAGIGMIDGAFPGFSANFNLTTSAVPVPAAAWLFGSGLLALIGVARRSVKT